MKKGFVLLEVLLSVLLLGIIITAIIGALIYAQETASRASNIGRAVALADEGLEAVRNIRDASFTNLIDGTYGLAVSGGQWVFSGNQDSLDIFTRQIIISTYGPQKKQVVSKVKINNQEKEVVLTTIMTNWRRPVSVGPSPLGNCNNYCVTLGYSSGICRQSVAQCNLNNEIYEVGGNIFCALPPNNNCCCNL